MSSFVANAASAAVPDWLQSRKLAALGLLLLFVYLLILTGLIFWAITGYNPLEVIGIGVGGSTVGTAQHLREQGQSDRSANYGGQYGPPPIQSAAGAANLPATSSAPAVPPVRIP